MQFKKKIKHDSDRIKRIQKNGIRIVLGIIILLWMMVIFGFSAADAEQSGKTSDVITEFVVNIFYDDFDELSYDTQQNIWSNVSYAVRKTGHFGEYAILAVLISFFAYTFEKMKKNVRLYFAAVIAFCAAYAVTDEFHQGFVDGRSPMLWDVLIDTAGGAAGSVFVRVIDFFSKKIVRKKRNRKPE